jgi:hypothetical protein
VPRNGATERTKQAQQAGCCGTPPKARTGGVDDDVGGGVGVSLEERMNGGTVDTFF